MDLWPMPRRAGGSCESVLLHAPASEASSGWGWLQKAKAKLYPLLQSRKEDFRLSGSPVYLLGEIYGDLKQTMMENPTLLVAFMLQAESGLKTMERAYDSGEMAKRTFAGHEAVAWLSAELPLNEEEACLAMQNTLRMRLVESLDGGALAEFVPSALYKFADEAKVIAPARRDYLRSSSDGHASAANHQDLMGHFHTLIWFSYRQEFPEIVPTPFRSDVGWGCMLRTGQMMLANVLQRRLLGSKWRLGASTEQEMVRHRAILSLFYDRPGPVCPYSIHNIAHVGTLFKKSVGEWFGPSIIANVMKLLVRKFSTCDFTFYLANERVLYRENVTMLCRSTPKHEVMSPRLPAQAPLLSALQQPLVGGWRPVIIMSCVRLGIDNLNPMYVDRICELFRLPQMAGIVGGKPNASLFFVGIQDDQVLYLDPHVVQPSVDPDDGDVSSYHTLPQKMPCRELDPCMAVCFSCETAEEFDDLCARLKEIEVKNPQSHVIGVGERDPDYGGVVKGPDPLAHLIFD